MDSFKRILAMLVWGLATVRSYPADTEIIETLTVEDAREIISEQRYGVMNLDGLASLPADVAQEVVEFKGHTLSLNGLTALSTDTAAVCGGFSGATLKLNGLPTLSSKAAAALANYRGFLLLNGLTSLDAKTAKGLKDFTGELVLDGVTNVTDDAALTLATFKCRSLSLDGVTTLSDQSVEAIASFRGLLSLMGLDGPFAIDALRKHLLGKSQSADNDSAGEQSAIPVDARIVWASPYFVVRKKEDGKFWLLTFNPIFPDCTARCPFLLVETSRTPMEILLESPGKTFRVTLLANQAIITFPGSDKVVSEDKYGGLWRNGRSHLSPIRRVWHPVGGGEVRGSVQLPTTVGSEDLRKLLLDLDTLKTLTIPISGDRSCEIALKDLPANECATAAYDLALANAPRWLKKKVGDVSNLEDGGVRYNIDVKAANDLLAAMPEEWQRIKEASKENAMHFAVLHHYVAKAIKENGATQETIRAALQKKPVLQQTIEELSDKSVDMLIEMVLTKFDERLTKPATQILFGQCRGLENLDAAVGRGDPAPVLDAWIRFSPEEKDALLALATQSLLGRLRCPHSKLSHIELLARVCEIVATRGPEIRDQLEQKREAEIDKILREQLKAAENSK